PTGDDYNELYGIIMQDLPADPLRDAQPVMLEALRKSAGLNEHFGAMEVAALVAESFGAGETAKTLRTIST
ncbi:hypothetical protein ACP3WV_23595, partial [Salmonella enterica]|uniref:hypothetical protein n=1 Tax=Salmonella enterica TaxID=28901 RepID=UPI003CECCC7F